MQVSKDSESESDNSGDFRRGCSSSRMPFGVLNRQVGLGIGLEHDAQGNVTIAEVIPGYGTQTPANVLISVFNQMGNDDEAFTEIVKL